MEYLGILFACAALVGLYWFRLYVGAPSNHSLLPYQVGILFRRGRPVREVGPGRHRVFLGRERIVFLDKRPIQVNVETRTVTLADGTTAFYGFAASAEVEDVKRALYCSATYTQIPAFVTLCVTRGMLNRSQASQLGIGRTALEEEIVENCRARLAHVGFRLLSFRLTQLAIAPAFAK